MVRCHRGLGSASAAAPALALHHPVRSPLLVLFGAVGFGAALAVVVGTGLPPTTSDLLGGAAVAGLVLGLSYPRMAPVVAAASAAGPIAMLGLGALVGPGDDGAAMAAALLALAVWGGLVGMALGIGERSRLQRLDA